jgi:hypothetical protein
MLKKESTVAISVITMMNLIINSKYVLPALPDSTCFKGKGGENLPPGFRRCLFIFFYTPWSAVLFHSRRILI